jgi:antitoxin ParD1/3/4
MATDSLTITLTGQYQEYVEARADAEGIASPEEYVRQLVREDRQRRLAALEDHLIEAMKGEPIPISEEELESDESICDILDRKIAARQGQHKVA